MSVKMSTRRESRMLGLAIAMVLGATPGLAREVDHSRMHMPPPAAAKKPVARKPTAAKKPASAVKPTTDPHAGHVMPAPAARPAIRQPAAGKPAPKPVSGKKPSATPAAKPVRVDPHAGHAMPAMTAEEHAAMGHAATQEPAEAIDHAAMGHAMPMPSGQPRTPIPVLTDADRIAAFPDVAGHPAHDEAIHAYWLLDRLEGWDADGGDAIAWEALGWVGTDLDRAWLRSEGVRIGSGVESAGIEVLYGRSVAPWWDVVAGLRHDFGEGPSQTFAALGVTGLAPQKFEVEATAYFGKSGQTAARLEAGYDTLLSNRLILQWKAEAEFYGKDDPRRGIGSGLGTIEAGLRLRYEFTRKFAPYVGVAWERAYGGTADFRRGRGAGIDDTRFVAGLRIWF